MFRSMIKEQAREELESFLFSIDDLLKDLLGRAGQQGYHLDFSLESLTDLACYIRANAVEHSRDHVVDFTDCWIYLGEVFRQTTPGARWMLGWKNPSDITYGLYFLTGFDEIESDFIPILYVNNFTKNQILPNHFFLNLIDNMLDPVPVDLEYLPTED